MAGKWAVCLLSLALHSWAITSEMQLMLNQHNLYRCMHGLKEFTWDESAAATAQAWANQGQWDHSDRTTRNGCGENLAWGHEAGDHAAQDWYEEIKYTEPYGTADSFTDSSPPGEVIGHYTAMMWAASTTIGCGKARATVNGLDGVYWVCHYCPGGNMQGEFKANVLPPIKGPEECGGGKEDVPDNFPNADQLAQEPAKQLPQEPPQEADEDSEALPPKEEDVPESSGTKRVSGELVVEGDRNAICANEDAVMAIKRIIAEWLGNPAWLTLDMIVMDCEIVGRRLQGGGEPYQSFTIQWSIQLPSIHADEIVAKMDVPLLITSVMMSQKMPTQPQTAQIQPQPKVTSQVHAPLSSMPENVGEAEDLALEGLINKVEQGKPTNSDMQLPATSLASIGAVSAFVIASVVVLRRRKRRGSQDLPLVQAVDE